MKTADFDYDLPPELIAQTPIEPRDAARLLCLDRSSGAIEHHQFIELPDLLRPGDLLVANESRVIPARIFAHKPTGGAVEMLLLRRIDAQTWQALLRGHKLRVGTRLIVRDDLTAEVIEQSPTGERVIRFNQPIDDQLDQLGVMPLPPYIHEPLRDPERYQTIYSHTPGSAAAPTAGLHFTPRVFDRLRERGIEVAYVTLHVGLDTFKPVETEDIEQHHIHTEFVQLTEDTASKVRAAKAAGRRVIAVGTTSVRVLETAAQHGLAAFTGDTALIHLSRFRVSRHRRLDHQFPFAALVAPYAGFSVGGQGPD